MKTAAEMAEAVKEMRYREQFIPTRYPYKYAYDFMRVSAGKIMPSQIIAAVNAHATDPGFWSRSDMARVSHEWAALEGITRDELLTHLANAYLLSVGLPIPETEDAPAGDERQLNVKKSEMKALLPVKIELTADTASGNRTESMHLTWKEASVLNRQLTSFLTKHAIRD